MSGAISTAAYVARRAAQKERVQILYRRALKDTLNWAVHRHLFYKDADDLRLRFEANKHVTDLDAIDRMIDEAEATYNKWRHPDPYIVPWAPGGSKFCRNPTPPEGVDMIHDFDAEDDHDHHPFPVIQRPEKPVSSHTECAYAEARWQKKSLWKITEQNN